MSRIIDLIRADPKNTTLELTDGQDDFCQACPHHGGDKCKKDEDANARMQQMDRNVLKKLSLENHAQNNAENLINLSNENLKTVADVTDICGFCPWREKCLWYGGLRVKA